jgi:competence protein ComEA
MLKKVIATLVALYAAAAFATTPVDINKATLAELEAVKGIGPVAAQKFVDERKKGTFKDWSDVMQRMKGIKEARAARLSQAGLTVNGQEFHGGGASPKKGDKAAKKAAQHDAPEAKLAKK